jgi:sulfur relay (sulfurtransferase) complex TusBCD TusD component (DsrE family)
MILQEIFKNDLELLENKSVKALLDYVQEQHKRSFEIHKRLKSQEDEILELFMYSEVILIEGKSAKETLKLIGNILSR